MTITAEERDRLGRVAYETWLTQIELQDDDGSALNWGAKSAGQRQVWTELAEAVRAAVLASDPFVLALWRLALAAYEISPIGETDDEDEFQEAVRAIVERPEWQQRQEQQP